MIRATCTHRCCRLVEPLDGAGNEPETDRAWSFFRGGEEGLMANKFSAQSVTQLGLAMGNGSTADAILKIQMSAGRSHGIMTAERASDMI